ncbi:MAG: ATPase domain-containing protein [Beijerinckiaceae bacterium]
MERLVRIATGISGLDLILHGGLFKGGVYIVQGSPGAGKTILANQHCFSLAASGGRALYVTLLAESHARMLAHIEKFGFFDATAIPDRVRYLSGFSVLEEQGLTALSEMLRREVSSHEATLLVIDGLGSAEEAASSPRELKKFIDHLQVQAAVTGCATLLLSSNDVGHRMVAAERTMVDGVIELQSRAIGRSAERNIEVYKFRGSPTLRGSHTFRISVEGIEVFPRIEELYASPSLSLEADGPKLSIGDALIDTMLDGGVSLHSASLILGPAGIGKTTIGLQFLGSGSGAALCVSFSESAASLIRKARALALPVADRFESGAAQIIWHPITKGLIDEICARIIATVRRDRIERLFIDGVDGLAKFSSEPGRIEALYTAFSNEMRALGVTLLSTAETDLAGIVPGQPLAGLSVRDLSPVAENVIVLRLAATTSEIHRLIAVLKSREGRSDMKFRRFVIAQGGVQPDSDHAKAEAILAELAAHRQATGFTPTAPATDPLNRGG